LQRIGVRGLCRDSSRRHWRGELTLAQAYWGVGLLLSLVAAGLSYGFGQWLGEANLSPVGVGVALVLFLSSLCVVTVWQLLGNLAGSRPSNDGPRAPPGVGSRGGACSWCWVPYVPSWTSRP